MKKTLGILSLIIILAIIPLTGKPPEAHANRLTNDAIKSMENQIANTKKEKDQLQGSLTNIQSIRSGLVNSRNDLARYIEELDGNLEVIEQNIVELLELIEIKEEEIINETEKLAEAIRVQEEQYAAMKVRIKHMYEQGGTYYINMLFGAGSFGEMLNRADYIESLAHYDSERLDEYVATTAYVALCKENLELEKEFLDEAKLAVEAEKKALDELIVEKTAQIEAVMGDIANQERLIREYEAEISAQNDAIRTLEQAVAAERARLAAANARKYDGGKFTWPVPSSTRISSEYGMRVHPVLGVELFHNGIDISAVNGEAIVAAYGGTVVAAEYHPTMGNYVMLDHGDGVYTIYMHASQLHVSKNADVSAGQRIAAIGSTGRSTGPHLHFSVRENGSYVSPWGYFGGR